VFRRHADRAIVIVCLVAGAIAGSSYYRQTYAAGGRPWFYQVDFGPAVMWTCGHGFVVPDDAAIPALGRFLRQEADRFSCAELPPQPPLRKVVGAQPWLMWSHLLRSAAVIWSVTGIGWTQLAPLAALFFGVTVALAFVVLRVVSGTVLSAAGALFVLTSPLFLIELPQFRDFSKVPFMLGVAWLLAQLLITPITPRRLLAVAAGYGAVVGLAIGFRNDVLITIPAFVLLLLAARHTTPLHAWRRRGVALLLAAFGFVVLSIPVLRVYANGGGASMSHAALLGMMRPIDSALGISNGGLYEIGYGLEDSYAAAVISGYASRAEGAPRPIEGHSPEYDAAATSYVMALVRTLPADTLTRAYAAIDRVVALPSSVVETQAPPYIASPMLHRVYAMRSRIALAVWWVWLPAVAAAVLLVSLRDLRLALLLALLFAYFCAYPAIQFNDRHVLHLSLIPIAALAYVVQTLITRQWGTAWRHALIVAAIVIAAVVLPLLIARKIQEQQVLALMHAYQAAPVERVAVSDRALGDGRVALDFDLSALRAAVPAGSVATDYLIADFDSSACDAAAVDLTVGYVTSDAFADFTRRTAVGLSPTSGSTRVMLATYTYAAAPSASGQVVRYRPQRLEMRASQRSCLTSIRRLRTPEEFPVLLNATLPADWEQLPLHLSLSRWEKRFASITPAVYLSPPDVQLDETSGAGELLRQGDLADRAPNVSIPADGRLSVDGVGGIGGIGAYAYLARFQERPLTRGQKLVIEGNLKQGGLSVGWISNGAWTNQLTITDPGPFVAALEAPMDGTYSFVIANNLKGSSLTNICEFTRMAWLR